MDTKEKLEADLKDAMRSGNDVVKRTIRMAITGIRYEQVAKGAPLDEAAILSILQKEIKIRREAIQDAQKANREDLIQDNLAEISVLESYLPKQMSEDEIKTLVSEAITEAGAKGPGDMGKVMKILLPKVKGKAPNDQVSRIVREVLSS
jgi:uncharacterized protein